MGFGSHGSDTLWLYRGSPSLTDARRYVPCSKFKVRRGRRGRDNFEKKATQFRDWASLGLLGRPLERLGAAFGAACGVSWAAFGVSWACLGHPRGVLEASWVRFGASGVWLGDVLGRFGSVLGRPRDVLGQSSGNLGHFESE